jgi:3-isopropylmalate/(R)-2-methylmalate dehydratase small subunit
MEAFTTLDGAAIVLDLANVDTDQIIPSRFMRTPRAQGYGSFLFHDLRVDAHGTLNPDFPVNAESARGAQILICGENFGCGSSREAAVYALADFGIRCMVGPSFGDIFRNNAFKNGLLTVVLEKDALASLRTACEGGSVPVRVDLAAQVISCGKFATRFAIESFWKECLLAAADDIDLTLREQGGIDEFFERRMKTCPWVAQPRRL